MRAGSFIDTGDWTFDPDDKIVTLSTCGADSYNRTLVMGILVNSFPDAGKGKTRPSYNAPSYEMIVPVENEDWLNMLKDKQFYIYLAVLAATAILISALIIFTKKRSGRNSSGSEDPHDTEDPSGSCRLSGSDNLYGAEKSPEGKDKSGRSRSKIMFICRKNTMSCMTNRMIPGKRLKKSCMN